MISKFSNILICFIFVHLLAFNKSFSQINDSSSIQHLIESPKQGLLALPIPQFERLDETVVKQIKSFQQSFLDLIARGNFSDEELKDAYGMLGQLYHAYEIFDSAESCYLNAIQLASNDYSWYHLLGVLNSQLGKLDEAVMYYKIAQDLQPSYVASSARLGKLYYQLQQFENAKKEFQAVLKVNPYYPSAHDGLGQVAMMEKDFELAVDEFRTVLEQVPEANRIHYSLAMAYRGKGDIENAKTHLLQQGSVGIRPEDSLFDSLDSLIQGERVNLIQGRMAFSAGRYNDAVILFSKAVKAKPDSERALINFGAALAQTGDNVGAIKQFRTALMFDSLNQNAHFNLGSLLYMENEFTEAIVHYNFVLRVNPNDIESKLGLAKALIKIEKKDMALIHLFQAIDIAPESEPIVLLLSNLLVNVGRYKEGLKYLEDANQRFPDRGLTSHDLARLLAACPDTSLRDGARAVDLASKVFKAQNSPLHAETLSMAFAEAGKCNEAANLQKQIVQFAEKNGDKNNLFRYRKDLARYEAGTPCRPPGYY